MICIFLAKHKTAQNYEEGEGKGLGWDSDLAGVSRTTASSLFWMKIY